MVASTGGPAGYGARCEGHALTLTKIPGSRQHRAACCGGGACGAEPLAAAAETRCCSRPIDERVLRDHRSAGAAAVVAERVPKANTRSAPGGGGGGGGKGGPPRLAISRLSPSACTTQNFEGATAR